MAWRDYAGLWHRRQSIYKDVLKRPRHPAGSRTQHLASCSSIFQLVYSINHLHTSFIRISHATRDIYVWTQNIIKTHSQTLWIHFLTSARLEISRKTFRIHFGNNILWQTSKKIILAENPPSSFHRIIISYQNYVLRITFLHLFCYLTEFRQISLKLPMSFLVIGITIIFELTLFSCLNHVAEK